MILMNHRFNLN